VQQSVDGGGGARAQVGTGDEGDDLVALVAEGEGRLDREREHRQGSGDREAATTRIPGPRHTTSPHLAALTLIAHRAHAWPRRLE
jgi:hypothetical protein